MDWIGRIMSAIRRGAAARHARILNPARKIRRPPPLAGKSGPRTAYALELSPKAIKLLEELAEQTDTTPSEVLRQSIVLYKMTLDAEKEESTLAPAGPQG